MHLSLWACDKSFYLQKIIIFDEHYSIPFGINPSDSKGKEPSFLDENGVVNDMEGYLDYDSVWDTKPSW